MSVLEQIAELDAQKAELIQQAHDEALEKAQAAIDELNSLGFKYKITGGKAKAPAAPKRRSGIRSDVLDTITAHKDGISRQDLFASMKADDKASQQSISNAVAALKKQSLITGDSGIYKAN